MIDLFLFPNQLYEKKYLIAPHLCKVYFVDDLIFYGKREGSTNGDLRFNLLKLQYQRLAGDRYVEYLKKSGYSVVRWDLDKTKEKGREYPLLSKNNDTRIHVYDVMDHVLEKKLRRRFDVVVIDSPNFVLSRCDLFVFHKGWDKGVDVVRENVRQSSLFSFVKGKVSILEGVKSYDSENRRKLPPNIEIPPLPTVRINNAEMDRVNRYLKRWLINGVDYREVEGAKIVFPYTHEGAKRWLKTFLRTRFDNFGTYQDAIDKDNMFLFHSCISPMLNLGLLNPDYIIRQVRKYKDSVDVNDYEAFIRQLIGWREYQRYIYVCMFHLVKDYNSMNYFNLRGRLGRAWYEGCVGVAPVDKCITRGWKIGYLHHIERLMVMGNFMTLSGISPRNVYKWFMEFALDSYDWVMSQNILMATYCDGGKTMSRPYLASSAYVLRMSNYKCKNKGEQGDNWCDVWDNTYHSFIKRNRKKLAKTIYAGK